MRKTRGFSLIEVLIATILVGMAIAALVAANSSFTMANDAGSDLSTAEFLIEQIRELTMMLPLVDPDASTWTVLGPESGEADVSAYDDVDDFDGATFSPPINSDRAPLTDFTTFSQQVTVEKLIHPISTRSGPTRPTVVSFGSRCAFSRTAGKSARRPGFALAIDR